MAISKTEITIDTYTGILTLTRWTKPVKEYEITEDVIENYAIMSGEAEETMAKIVKRFVKKGYLKKPKKEVKNAKMVG